MRRLNKPSYRYIEFAGASASLAQGAAILLFEDNINPDDVSSALTASGITVAMDGVKATGTTGATPTWELYVVPDAVTTAGNILPAAAEAADNLQDFLWAIGKLETHAISSVVAAGTTVSNSQHMRHRAIINTMRRFNSNSRLVLVLRNSLAAGGAMTDVEIAGILEIYFKQ